MPAKAVPVLEKHYTISEVAELLSVSRDQVERWLRNGELRARVVGARRRIADSEVRRYLDANDPNGPLVDDD